VDYEWDPEKARSNNRKHRVTFDQAKATFDDPNVVTELDDSSYEERWNAIGLSKGHILFVVYIEPDPDTVRIISARRADKDEQDRYYRQALPQG
jgi:uncharacterized protein